MSVYRLTSVINQKEYFSLMKKYFKSNINADEQANLLREFGFSTKDELTLFFKSYLEYKEKVHIQFPELQKWDAVKNQVFVACAEVL